jgi:hypothetical protein
LQWRLGGLGVHAAAAQFGAQGQQHVEHHADAGQVLARELAARLVRVHDHRGVGQCLAGQVGHHDVDAARVGGRHAVDAGDAVVDRDDHIRLLPGGQFDDFRRQAVAVLEAVRHDVVDARAQHAQAAHPDRAGGGAVAIVVGHDQQLAIRGNRVGQVLGGVADALHRRRRHQFGQVGGQFGRVEHAARRQDARQRGMQAGGRQRGVVVGKERMAIRVMGEFGQSGSGGHGQVGQQGAPVAACPGRARTCAGRRVTVNSAKWFSPPSTSVTA